MSQIVINGSSVGTALQQLLMCDELTPGSEASYQLCKTIYEWHPLGLKMAQKPLRVAMSRQREIVVSTAPNASVVKAFEAEWLKLDADGHILNVGTLARVYGIASLAFGAKDIPTSKQIPPEDYAKLNLYFNDLDPLNTSGSLVLNQDPNSPDFQKHAAIAVAGQPYHRSRSVTLMNEKPIYISYTTSGFGFVGRSVYQRALFPLKSFVQTMITDDMVTRKAGLLVAKMKQPGSIADNLMAKALGIKRNLLKEASTNNVISIGQEDAIETLDMQNAEKANYARKNVLENIAAADDMPARMLTEESLSSGLSEGSEDAEKETQYVGRIRKWLDPLYAFFDPIVMYRAWTPEFYDTVKAQFPEEYADVPYATAFTSWVNSFTATWPNLREEPDSELAKAEKVRVDGVIQLLTTLGPMMDPENKALLAQWAADNLNDMKSMFTVPLALDYEALAAYEPPDPVASGGGEAKADAEHWITTETGSHLLIEGDPGGKYVIKGGAGGKLNGKEVSPKSMSAARGTSGKDLTELNNSTKVGPSSTKSEAPKMERTHKLPQMHIDFAKEVYEAGKNPKHSKPQTDAQILHFLMPHILDFAASEGSEKAKDIAKKTEVPRGAKPKIRDAQKDVLVKELLEKFGTAKAALAAAFNKDEKEMFGDAS